MNPSKNLGLKVLLWGECISKYLHEFHKNFIVFFVFDRLHIRRTDKIGSEASRYEVQKYMNATEMYFAPMERQSGITLKRRIFIASDDPSVIKEAKKAYADYRN